MFQFTIIQVDPLIIGLCLKGHLVAKEKGCTFPIKEANTGFNQITGSLTEMYFDENDNRGSVP